MKERHNLLSMHDFISLASILLVLFLLFISVSNLSAADEHLVTNEMGFYFQHPTNWTISNFGSRFAGNLSMTNSSACITITWMRDPGSTPKEILDQVVKTYNQDDVEVYSQRQGQGLVHGQEAETLDISYKFRSFDAKKRLAAWTSNESDRLFFASMSSSNDDYARNEEIFNRVLSTFQDKESTEVTLRPRSIQDDSWAIVLGDLLATHHYKDQSIHPAALVYAQSVQSLIPANNSYRLSSTENILSVMSETTIIRARAVQELLLDSGYEALLMQKRGQIWVVVKDPSDRWQSVSLNPKEPWRMVGALVTNSEGYRGVLCKDINELAKDNSLTLNWPVQYNENIQKDCDPPRYLELKSPAKENKTWTDELQHTLNSYNYPKKYQENIFDCSNTSQICWALLENKGYDARLMFSYKDHPRGRHMWVIVRYPYEYERYVAIEATNTDGKGDLLHLGRVVFQEEYFRGIIYNTSMQYSWLHPEEGMWL